MALADVENAVSYLFRRLLPVQETTIVAAEAIPALRAVRIVAGQATVATGFAVPNGFTQAGAAQGGPCTVVTSGTVVGAIAGGTFGQRFWLTTTGASTQTEPTAQGAQRIVIAFAVSATDLSVQIINQGPVP